MSAPLSRKAPPDGGLAERSGEMGRKPALHSSCSKTGAKVGISMLIDKHCQLKSCNPCQPTRACMPHWAARRPQQAHGSPAPRTTPTHPHTTTPDSPTKDSKKRPRRQQSPTPPTLNETTTGHGRRNACGSAIKRPCSSDIGHNSVLSTSHSPISSKARASCRPSLSLHTGATTATTSFRPIRNGQHRTKPRFFSTHMVWPRHSNPNDFNTELLMRCDLLSNSYLCSICDSSNTTNS